MGVDNMNDAVRESYTFTLRANQYDTNRIELIRYLKKLERRDAHRMIESALMAELLTLAKQETGKYSPEQLRVSCLESCKNLCDHLSYLRQLFNIVESHSSNTTHLDPQPQQLEVKKDLPTQISDEELLDCEDIIDKPLEGSASVVRSAFNF